MLQKRDLGNYSTETAHVWLRPDPRERVAGATCRGEELIRRLRCLNIIFPEPREELSNNRLRSP